MQGEQYRSQFHHLGLRHDTVDRGAVQAVLRRRGGELVSQRIHSRCYKDAARSGRKDQYPLCFRQQQY